MTGSAAPVLIVGAGPTGLTAAALLAAFGVRSLVVERHAEAYQRPRAVHLDDEAMRILQAAGVAASLLPLTRPAHGLALLDARHRVFASFARPTEPGRTGYPGANMFDQPDLDRLLLERARTLPEVELAFGRELVSLDGATATLRDTDTGDRSQHAADFVLGCDGAQSAVRRLIASPLTELAPPQRWLVIDVLAHRPLTTWPGVQQVCDPGRAATYMQVGPDRHRFEFRLHDGETATGLAGRAAELLSPWTGSGLRGLEIIRSAEYTFRATVATWWRRGPVLLLGDAAHQTPPFIGQGLGAGLRDAVNLAWKLARVLQGASPSALLDTYQSEREPHARAMIRTATVVGWAMTGGRRSQTVRRVALSGLSRVPLPLLDRGSPALRPGTLVHRRPGGLEGRLAPQPWIATAAGDVRLDEALGPGFSVLALTPVHAETSAVAASLGARIVIATGPAAAWLHAHRAFAVLVRPDRVVLEVDRGSGLSRVSL